MREISDELYAALEYRGVIDETGVRGHLFGASHYNEHLFTLWAIWLDYPKMNEFKKQAMKYIMREKDTDTEEMDIHKAIHYLEERLRQIEIEKKYAQQ